MEPVKTDLLIIGGGIVGLTIAREFSLRQPKLRITVVEKEPSLALHASGRNSGVVHAGFYYTPDTLKARLTIEGNRLMTEYCLRHKLAINRCGKVVVAKDERELEMLFELKRRGDKNGVDLKVVSAGELSEIEPNANTFKKAIYSPSTSTLNPVEVVNCVANEIKGKAEVLLGEKFIAKTGPHSAETTTKRIEYRYLVNAAGLYADKVAHKFNVGRQYTVIPFKGLYMEYADGTVLKRHVYPVPDLDNPFLGVHFTKTVDGKVKIGPTATPAFWRENYEAFANFRLGEFFEILGSETNLFIHDSFGFRRLAFQEIKKYYGHHMIRQAAALVKEIDPSGFGGFIRPGIRAQLLNTNNNALVMDFVLEHGENSTHVLNAVSPAFTCSFAFSAFAADEIEKKIRF